MADRVGFPPSVIKACGRCYGRKVKCDLQVPTCSACKRQNEECNITDCVAYPYTALKSLQDTIQDLEARIEELSSSHRNDDGVGPQAPSGGADGSHRVRPGEQTWTETIRAEAEEIGVLAIGGPDMHSESKYIGSAAGSTFARIFFKEIHLVPPSMPGPPYSIGLDQDPAEGHAALPPQPVAMFLLHAYIARVHMWWPLLPLPYLRRTLGRIYEDPKNCSSYEKFLVFAVLALASVETAESADYARMLDLNTPSAYHRTSLRFFACFHETPRDLSNLRAVLLLSIWMLGSNLSSHNNDLWQLSRYAMSLAVEIGLHRHGPAWGFRGEELEIRNRTWWCTYALERQVAIITGRVLSIRDHAISALKPAVLSLDALNSLEANAAPMFQRKAIRPFNHLLRLRQIAGRVLESVYIARGPDGTSPFTTFQEIYAQFSEIEVDLEQWKRDVDPGMKGSREHWELKVEYCLLLLLMNRPSSSFMIPSHQMVAISSKAASSAVRQWRKIVSSCGISAVCRCFRQFHAILMVGLAALYCDWHKGMAGGEHAATSSMPTGHTHRDDVGVCLDLMAAGIAYMKAERVVKYQHLLRAARDKVYGPALLQGQKVDAPSGSSFAPVAQSPEHWDIMDSDSMPPLTLPTGNGLSEYINQVTSFFDDGMVPMDDALAAWYGSVMEEMQPQTSSGAP